MVNRLMRIWFLNILILTLGATANASAADIQLVQTLPTTQLQMPFQIVAQPAPSLDFAECVAKVSAGCHASGYLQCTEWSTALCREKLPAYFPACFSAVEESCRREGRPNCPEYAVTICSK